MLVQGNRNGPNEVLPHRLPYHLHARWPWRASKSATPSHRLNKVPRSTRIQQLLAGYRTHGETVLRTSRRARADVTERLKGMSQCDGQGPAFKESQVRQAIEESAAPRSTRIQQLLAGYRTHGETVLRTSRRARAIGHEPA
jgi:hypothetical protein